MTGVKKLVAPAAVVAVVALIFGSTQVVFADHAPANKVWAAASTLEVMETQQGVGQVESQHVVLSRGSVKLSNPTDLLISVTAECALWTNTATTGDDDSESKARVEIWITLDGKTVPVSNLPGQDPSQPASTDPDDQADRGRAVFCNRANRMKTENIETVGNIMDLDTEDDILIRSYNRSRNANAFNWAALDVGRDYDANGDNIIDIEVHARLAAEVIDGDTSDNTVNSPAALAAVGKRTLVVEPTKMANDIVF